MMRIITGSARGTKLEAPAGLATRPTAERVKEAVFSMLMAEWEGRRVLDLFGGSGQMALEALSRGAAEAVVVDAAHEAIGVIERNAARTHLADRTKIVRSDALSFLRSCREPPFHYVFLDPPYASGLLPSCLSLLAECGLLAEGARVICEAGRAEDVFGDDAALAKRFRVLKCNRYGAAHIVIVTLVKEDLA
ncbi:MAG: 16S rRNA (guanine(966)-N(2))-methyltransferase RsmD [Clostridia bacterium]|nr:16S rRNA (guanine(966)-N(2))-methyltransferase RsmD [Clostridia bacterium]